MSALNGLRVVEISGAFTAVGGRLLAELGADVVVVEPPAGSAERARPPFAGDITDPNRSLRFWAGNVGKRSVTVDLATADGVDSLRSLVGSADIVLEGAGPGLDELDLGYDSTSAANAAVIWVSVTPFGRSSSRSAQPTTDLTMLAGGGPVWNCGYDDHSLPPIRGGGDQSANIAGQYAAIGALVALASRDQDGRGQLVDVNVNAACNVTCEQVTYNWLLINEVCTRQTGRHAYYVETAPVQVRCADGAYATTGVLPRSPQEFRAMHEWLSELDLIDELPEVIFLEMAAARTESIDLAQIGQDDETTAMVAAARDAIALIASNLPARDFFVQSQQRGFPAGAVLSPDEAFEDPHSAARGFQVAVEHDELEETYLYPGAPYLFSKSRPVPSRRPPLVGEHNAELLGEGRP